MIEYFQILISITLIDWFFVRNFIQKKAQYFFLHILFNSWVTYICFNNALKVLINPNSCYSDFIISDTATLSTKGIVVFHFYHSLMESKNLSFEDWVHHIISCFFVGAIGINCKGGRIVDLINIFMCGIPGGIDYCLLFLVKYNIIDKLSEKRLNRLLNLLIRMPGMMISFYIWLFHIHIWIHFDYFQIIGGIVGMGLHTLNSIYYCDKVVGNYHLTCYKIKQINVQSKK